MVRDPYEKPFVKYPAKTSINPDLEKRLVDILPGAGTQEIQCRLCSDPLESTGTEYEALSYVWGKWEQDLRYQPSVRLDGSPGFFITRNLDNAIRRLRYHDKPRKMWIDQLCINQECECARGKLFEESSTAKTAAPVTQAHTCEKKRQVQHMGSIFRNANRVVVWLGDCYDTKRTGPGELALDNNNDKAAREALREAMSRGLADPWYTRAWVIEEYVLARGEPLVRFGAYQRTWKEMVNLISSQATIPQSKWARISVLMDSFEALRGRSFTHSDVFHGRDDDRDYGSSLHLLSLFLRETRTRNPEDKVYCILESLSRAEASLITTGRGGTVGEVFARATWASIASSGSLGILSLVSRLSSSLSQSSNPHGVSSWVVDFTFQEKSTIRFAHFPEGSFRNRIQDWGYGLFQTLQPLGMFGIFNFYKRQRGWCRNKPQKEANVVYSPSGDQRKLVVTGLEFDTVNRVVDFNQKITFHAMLPSNAQSAIATFAASSTKQLVSAADSVMFDSQEREVIELMKRQLSQGSPYSRVGSIMSQSTQPVPAKGDNCTISVRAAMAGAFFRKWDKHAKPPGASRKTSLASLGLKVVAESMMPGLFGKPANPAPSRDDGKDKDEYAEWFCNFGFVLLFYLDTRGASFFLSSAGFIGLGPADLRADDKIVLLYGSRYPAALRRSNTNNWLFVGFIFVHGIMDNDLWDCFPNIDLTQSDFVLE